MLEAHFGVPAAGGILVAVNHRLAGAEVGYILRHSGARYLLLDTGLEELAGQAGLAGVTVIRCAGTGAPGDPYEEFLADASPERPVSWLEHEEETISVNYTSGTTGRPKGVQYTYRGAYLNALNEVIVAGMSADSVYLWTLPMFHCNGWCFTWAVTAAAARHVTMRAVDAQRVWELIDSEGVTHYTPPCSNARSSGYPTRTGGSGPRRSSPSTRARHLPLRRSSPSAASAWLITSAPMRLSSGRCRRHPPARSRSSCCVTANGRTRTCGSAARSTRPAERPFRRVTRQLGQFPPG